jgi:hypothetical protein
MPILVRYIHISTTYVYSIMLKPTKNYIQNVMIEKKTPAQQSAVKWG